MFRFHASTLAVAAALTAVILPSTTALAQTSKVVPVSAATAEGDSSSFHPFLYDAGRAQVVWTASAIARGAAVLTSVDFRRDGSKAAYAAQNLALHVMSLGHTSVTPASMSTTYTANITSTMTTVVNGKYSIAALPAPTSPPAPFAIKYPMKSPFIYTTAKGNLLLEWITGSGQATNKQNYELDAVTNTTGGSGGVRQFGSWGKFAGSDPANWKTDAQKLVPGGAADITLAGFGQAYPANLFIGVSDKSFGNLTLPYDLVAIGAPGNTLYTGLDAIVPFTLKETSSSSGVWAANPVFPLPNNSKLIGVRAFIQTYYADAKANAAGLVASDAMELTIGNPGPIGAMIGKDGTTSPTGQVMRFIPVVQFVGAIN